MPDLNKDSQGEDLEAPPMLVSALKKLPRERIFIPPSIDESVLMAARRRLAIQGTRTFPWFRWSLWAAATAIVVAIVTLTRLSTRQPAPLASPSAFITEDINHDGEVDILDAFALAKQLKSGPPPGTRLDINGDGIVDERDVATIAARAVRLEKGNRS